MSDVKLFWSMSPGKFVNKNTGDPEDVFVNGYKFKGTSREWYETLVETTIDCSNALHRQAAKIMGPCNIERVDVYASSRMKGVYERTVLFHSIPKGAVTPRMDVEPVVPFGKIAHKTLWENADLPVNTVEVIATFKPVEVGEQRTFSGLITVLDSVDVPPC